MKQYVKGRCDMYAYTRTPGGVRQKIIIEVNAVFRVQKIEEKTQLEAAKRIHRFLQDRHGDPAELGNIGVREISKEIIEYFPDCVECEAKATGGKDTAWFCTSSIFAKRPRQGCFYAW